MNLLIADDELIIRKGLLSLPWDTIGIEKVYEAENGIEARSLLENEVIDIVISDIRMPGLTGLELAEYIKDRSRDTVVILLTGFSDFEYAQKAISSHVYEYMLKPLRPKDILKTVSEVMIRLEWKRYSANIVRKYEGAINAREYSEQIIHYFYGINPQVMEVLQDMAQSFSQELTLSSMAEKYHFSVGYLSRMIKKETDYSFSDILNAIRLAASAESLREGSEKINLICEKTGFSDQRYFSQVFKKVFQCSPSEFRKRGMDEEKYRIKDILERMKENR